MGSRCVPGRGRCLAVQGGIAALAACVGLLVLAGPSSAQMVLPAAVRPADQAAAQERAELFRQLQSHAEVLQKQAAVVKTVAKLIGPSVVHIEADATARHALQLQVGPGRQVEESGSGVVVELNAKTYILTSRHVIREAAPSAVKINLADGRRIYPEKLWEDRETDVAVLAVAAAGLVAAPLGNSDPMEIGDFVMAVGAPFGLVHSVTYGIISAKGRWNLKLDDPQITLQDFLQTDAAINPGNSGGPLVNLRGEVIGINTCIASKSGGNEGVGFAIPINRFLVVARQLVERGQVARAFLGVTLDSAFTADAAAKLGLPRPAGARVVAVTENSPAAAANVRDGDIILQLDGVPIESDGHLINLVGFTEVGKQVTLLVFRDGQTLALPVVTGRKPESIR